MGERAHFARALAPVSAFTRVFDALWARVNAVAPGFVATEWTSQWPDERKRASVDRTLMKRQCTAADIAGAIVFLCADNSMITAQTLVVDGGYSL